MVDMVRTNQERHARRAWRAYVAERSPMWVCREVLARTFRGSRAELEQTTARRLQAAVVLLFLAVRCFHLGQAGVNLALAGGEYTVPWLAVMLGAACAVDSVVLAALTLGARQLTQRAILIDAAFGAVGLAVMAIATSSGPGRAGSLNWMLPYTVATATGLGVLAGGDLVEQHSTAAPGGEGGRSASSRPALRRVWPFLCAVGLGGVYVASTYLPHRLASDDPGQIWSNAANYFVFFAAGALTLKVAGGRVAALSARNVEVEEAAAAVAREAQWKAISGAVFDPAIALFDRMVSLPDEALPTAVRHEADRLIEMIEAVKPGRGASPVESEVG